MCTAYVGSQAVARRAGAQGYAVPRVSFGRRLALLFVLIAIVPTTALIAILLFVSEDSQTGKADARIAAGLQTALAVYEQRVDAARAQARGVARDPALTAALRGEPGEPAAWALKAANRSGIARVELFDAAGAELAAAGDPDSVAFGRVGLTESSRTLGSLQVSVTTGSQFVDDVKRLTGREVVVRRGDQVLARRWRLRSRIWVPMRRRM
jgi:hypothetical protein